MAIAVASTFGSMAIASPAPRAESFGDAWHRRHIGSKGHWKGGKKRPYNQREKNRIARKTRRKQRIRAGK